jgi:hypothetical protein
MKVRLVKLLSDKFPIQNCLKKGDELLPLHFNFALDYAIRNILENQVGLDLLIYADDINMLGDSINTKNENTESPLEACRNVGLEKYAEKTNYMVISHHPY